MRSIVAAARNSSFVARIASVSKQRSYSAMASAVSAPLVPLQWSRIQCILLLKDKFQNSIIVGHLAPYVINSKIVDLVVILRRSPYELKKIYQKRCYSDSKTRANINAEILGILSYDASKNFDFSKLSELENSSNLLPSSVAQSIYDMCLNAKSRSFGFIDWISLIQSDSEMLKYIK